MRSGWCGSHRPPLECEAGNKDYVSRNTATRTLFHFSIHVILHLVYSAGNVDPTGNLLSQDGKRTTGEQLVSGLNQRTLMAPGRPFSFMIIPFVSSLKTNSFKN